MSKHTPTPWIADDFLMEDETYTRVGTTDGTSTYYQRSVTICECYIEADEGLPDLRAEANAAFIVRACNSHDALVALVERYASECGECGGKGYVYDGDAVTGRGPDDVVPNQIVCHECEDIRVALESVEQPQPVNTALSDKPEPVTNAQIRTYLEG